MNSVATSGSMPTASNTCASLERPSPQFVGILRNGERVQIDDAIERLAVVLIGHPVAERAEQVAELHISGGLDAREHTSHERRCYRYGSAGPKGLISRAGRRRMWGSTRRRCRRRRATAASRSLTARLRSEPGSRSRLTGPVTNRPRSSSDSCAISSRRHCSFVGRDVGDGPVAGGHLGRDAVGEGVCRHTSRHDVAQRVEVALCRCSLGFEGALEPPGADRTRWSGTASPRRVDVTPRAMRSRASAAATVLVVVARACDDQQPKATASKALFMCNSRRPCRRPPGGRPGRRGSTAAKTSGVSCSDATSRSSTHGRRLRAQAATGVGRRSRSSSARSGRSDHDLGDDLLVVGIVERAGWHDVRAREWIGAIDAGLLVRGVGHEQLAVGPEDAFLQPDYDLVLGDDDLERRRGDGRGGRRGARLAVVRAAPAVDASTKTAEIGTTGARRRRVPGVTWAPGSWSRRVTTSRMRVEGRRCLYRVPDMPYEVQTPVFEGPFDLLLHLILREQVDLYEVSLSRIVDAYITELEKHGRPRSRGGHRVPADRSHAGRAQDQAVVARRTRRRPGRRVRTLGRARHAAGTAARLQDVQGRGEGRWPPWPTKRHTPIRACSVSRTSSWTWRPIFSKASPPTQMHAAFLRATAPKPVPTVSVAHLAEIRASVTDAVEELIDELPRVGRTTFRELTRHSWTASTSSCDSSQCSSSTSKASSTSSKPARSVRSKSCGQQAPTCMRRTSPPSTPTTADG